MDFRIEKKVHFNGAKIMQKIVQVIAFWVQHLVKYLLTKMLKEAFLRIYNLKKKIGLQRVQPHNFFLC